MGISNELQEVPISEPAPFWLGPLRDRHHFLLSPSAPTHLLSQDFLEKYHARISFSQKKEIIVEFDSSHKSTQEGELKDPLTSFICSISDGTRADSGNTDHLSLLNQLPPFLWVKSPTYAGKIHSTPLIKIQIDPSKPLPRVNQYPISKEALQGIKPITEITRLKASLSLVLAPVRLQFYP